MRMTPARLGVFFELNLGVKLMLNLGKLTTVYSYLWYI